MTSPNPKEQKKPRKKGSGGFRKGAGLKASVTDGRGLTRYSVMLDAYSVRMIAALGEGNISEGMRKAARLIRQLGVV